MPARCSQLFVGTTSVVPDVCDVVRDDIQRLALFVDHVCDVTEKLVQLTDRRLDVANLRLSLDDE